MTGHITTKFGVAMIAVGSMALAACSESSGGPSGQASTQAGRTVEIEMRDIAFDPDQVDVRAGETVRFVFTNVGEATHDAFIGDEAAQAGHEMEMQQADAPDHMSEDSGSGATVGGITVEPGGRGEITHTFADGEQLIIGCHQPGHYDGGMRISLNPTRS